jgi:hypothetical protein
VHRLAVERYVRGWTISEANDREVSFELPTGELMSVTEKWYDADTVQVAMKAV